jgi:hypothetical protein
MDKLSKERFDGLMGSTRIPWTRIAGIERAWYSEEQERVLCVVVEDTTDGDFVGIMLARDAVGRYRAVDLSRFYSTLAEAEAAVPSMLRECAKKAPKDFVQGDEPRRQMDFFAPRHSPERLNPDFASLVKREELSAAKGIIESMMYYFEDPDGNFVEQFQSAAFNSRIWELYLFAMLAENRCLIDRTHPAPDYLFTDVFGAAFIEAVTVNPSGRGNDAAFPVDEAELQEFKRNFLPIKFAGPLTTKLGRRYWEQSFIGERPVVLAIADLHQPGATSRSQDSLLGYLYGQSFEKSYDAAGRPKFIAEPCVEHVYNSKRVPSHFFALQDSEYISAVMSLGEDLIQKFNRMGFRAGFGSKRLNMIVSGKRNIDHPSRMAPEEFRLDVRSADYEEYWTDGMRIYHNPNALKPLDMRILGNATHYFWRDGEIHGVYVDRSSFGLNTIIHVDDSNPKRS